METSVNNKYKAFTSIEQSKKLAEILPIESSDHHYVRKVCDFRGNSVDGEWSCPKYGNINSKYANYIVQNFTRYEIIPCWSLAALLDVLPNYQMQTQDDGIRILCSYKGEFNIVTADNPIDTCYEMVLKLHEQNPI